MDWSKSIERVANELAGLIIVIAGAYSIITGNKEMAEMALQWGAIFIFGTGAIKIAKERGRLPNG